MTLVVAAGPNRRKSWRSLDIVTSWEQRGIEKGMAIGFERGRREGIEEGWRETLRELLPDLLAARFGTSDESLGQRLAAIDSVDELKALIHRALKAPTLEDVGLPAQCNPSSDRRSNDSSDPPPDPADRRSPRD